MKYFVYNQENGFIAVACLFDDDMDPHKEISPDGIYMTMEETLELDNDFFRAFQLKDGKIVANIEKAREITQERIRLDRIQWLEKLDILYQRALESGKDLKEIEAEKQRLRDLPDKVKDITDLKELKAIEVKTELEFNNLKELDYSTDQYILNLQRENEELKGNVEVLTSEMNKIMTALKKKYII
jgi:hypothetical protein